MEPCRVTVELESFAEQVVTTVHDTSVASDQVGEERCEVEGGMEGGMEGASKTR